MTTVLSTIIYSHDLRLVALAGLICAIASFTGIGLLTHARNATGLRRAIWVAISAVSVGFGIWSTHFVAMLSFSAGMATGYDIPLSLASLGIAVAITGLGLWLATVGNRRSDYALAGAIVGFGVVAMHYVGMSALLIGGKIVWDPALVAASILLGMALGSAALYFGTMRQSLPWRVGSSLILTLAICAMHFTAMGAADLSNCYPIVGLLDATPDGLAIGVAATSLLILGFALAGTYLDLHRRRVRSEYSHMRGLVDAALEGLLVSDGSTIITVNSSFLVLAGITEPDAEGRSITEFLDTAACGALFARPNQPLETDLIAADGTRLPVEAILRSVNFGGKLRHAIAIRDLRARRDAESHIRFLAHHDVLTGLPNRASFNRALEGEIAHARRNGQRFAVLCLDLDRFKEVNDLFGHAAGDALLQRVANLLRDTLGDKRMAARLGGDEFAVIVPDMAARSEAGDIARNLLDAFYRTNQSASDGAAISASIGIAIYPDDSTEAGKLMNEADTALYRAKLDGRGICRYFETEMGAAVHDRRLLEHDLRHAVERHQLRLQFQPLVNVRSGEVTGFEALLRWDHPQRGTISPAIFIPIAEESGLILQIGEWVLLTACAEAATWANPLRVAVNVSTVQIHHAGLPQLVQDVLDRTGLPAPRLELEITETALIRDMGRALAALHQIKSLGVRIAMDDFGTGYSSLSNLRAFPFDKIKIDQSFVRSVDTNSQSAAIVRAVLGLGNGLDLPVVAEGVERPEELDFLRAEMCFEVQGYLMSRPMPIESFSLITQGITRTLPISATRTGPKLLAS